MPRLTVLVCSHDRAALLVRALQSLNAAQRPAGWDVDLLVVANDCSDGTHARLDDYQRQARTNGWLPLDWFAEPVPGKSNALNSALPRLKADLVAFVDDDHRAGAGYLSAVCRAADAHRDADLFCGRILPDWDGNEPAWVHDTGPYRIYPLPVPRFDLGDEGRELDAQSHAIPGGGNLFLRTEWAVRIGKFATDLGPRGHDLGGAEDLDWVLRGLRLGARLRYVPEAVQYHYVDPARLTLPYLMEKAYKRTASSLALQSGQLPGRVPPYLWRKLGGYAVRALFSLNTAQRRFYCVRTAAALGEVAGHRLARQRAASTQAGGA